MSQKPLESTFTMTESPLTEEQIKKSIRNFDYYMQNCQQIVDKTRQLKYMALNNFQQLVFKELGKLTNAETRLNRRLDVVFCKSRQVGATTGMIGFVNYLLAYGNKMENVNVAHVFPVKDSFVNIYEQKIKPIITGVHPDIMATIYKQPAGSSTLSLLYDNTLGVRRNNSYTLGTANSSAIRGGTYHIVILDEVASYRNPEELEDAISGGMPDDGFSLMVYASTFDDKMSDYFRQKIITAKEAKDGWLLIFAPWFITYPEVPEGLTLEDITLDDYDRNVIIPAFKKYDYPKELWADAIEWYHLKSTRISNMKKEYPTTIDEIIESCETDSFFQPEQIKKQEDNIEAGAYYRLMTTVGKEQKTSLVKAEEPTPIRVFRKPKSMAKYVITVDPITSMSPDSDFFAASVWNAVTFEQVATFRDKELSTEEYAEYIVGLAKIYNNAIICPERNVAEGFVICVKALKYYRLHYENGNKNAVGIRTTVGSKNLMLDRLSLMLNSNNITLHDRQWVEEMRYFSKVIKDRGYSTTVSIRATRGRTDDCIATMWILAGYADSKRLIGHSDGDDDDFFFL